MRREKEFKKDGKKVEANLSVRSSSHLNLIYSLTGTRAAHTHTRVFEARVGAATTCRKHTYTSLKHVWELRRAGSTRGGVTSIQYIDYNMQQNGYDKHLQECEPRVEPRVTCVSCVATVHVYSHYSVVQYTGTTRVETTVLAKHSVRE